MSEKVEQAKIEIHKSLVLSGFCMRRIGLSFLKPKTNKEYWKQKAMFVFSMTSICYHVFGDLVYIGLTLSNSPRVEDVVPLLHTFGYGALSIAKVFVLWYKIDVFGQLLNELAEIWPMPPLDEEYQAYKYKSLRALSLAHRCYLGVNLGGVWFYNITPIAVYFYERYWLEEDATVGYVWKAWYPFDKHAPVGHVVVYLFEMLAGQICVWIMVCTDLLFSGMASHIGLLLRLLQRKLECIGDVCQSDEDQYEEIKSLIKLHQRLIKYCNDLEDAFSLSNLVNVIFSSINICCVVFVIVVSVCITKFNIIQAKKILVIPRLDLISSSLFILKLLEPLMEVSNKLFLGSALLQIGLICWYADDICHANSDVSVSAYNSRWYVTNPRCRRALMFLMKRAQKPIAFTAMNFMDMNLVTYTAILTRSYSYFALLYTMYSDS